MKKNKPMYEMFKSLPREIVNFILSKLPLSSLIRFKCVCRAWMKSVQDYFRSEYLFENNRYCLIFHSQSKTELSFVDFNSNNSTTQDPVAKKIRIPFSDSVPEFDLVASCNGLLCLSDSTNHDLYIHNPFTFEYKKLPKTIAYSRQFEVYGFGFHPKTKDHKVVKIIYYHPNGQANMRASFFTGRSEAQVLTLGTDSWRSLGQISHFLAFQGKQVLVNERLHWLTEQNRYRPDRDIVSFDLEDEEFRKVETPDCFDPKSGLYIVELRGTLGVVSYTNCREEVVIWAMKEYGVKESWVNFCKINLSRYDLIIPEALHKKSLEESCKIIVRLKRGFDRVLCELSNGEILLLYESRAMVVYDPKNESFRDIVFQGLPNLFQPVFHLGNHNKIDTIIGL